MIKRAVKLDTATILITGAAGFIGANLAVRLLGELSGSRIVGIDNLSDYGDPALKQARLDWIGAAAAAGTSSWEFVKASISQKEAVDELFDRLKPSVVVNLAAQPGVRYSIDHPDVYIQTNVVGFFNVLEACRHHPVEHLVYASSSSVYGGNEKVPFSTNDKTDSPISLYAATKKSDELLAYAYSSLYGIPATGLRFFTVYGPWGRPDMFVYGATEKLLCGQTIRLYGNGLCKRDFTFIDDIVEGVLRVMAGAPQAHATCAPHAVYNIGGGTPVQVMEMVETLGGELEAAGALPAGFDLHAQCELAGMQPGDVPLTFADTSALERDYGFTPHVGLREGLRSFVAWYVGYHGIETGGCGEIC